MNTKSRTKLTEECGELVTVLAKIEAFGSLGQHWDGKGSLQKRLSDEIADVMASCCFAMMTNNLDVHEIGQRLRHKLRLFHYWNDGGHELVPPTDYQPTEAYDVNFVFAHFEQEGIDL